MVKKRYSHWRIVLTSTDFIVPTIRNLRSVNGDLINNYSKIALIALIYTYNYLFLTKYK